MNILGNWVLIYGVAGFPELGLLGAGISTLASRILMALAMVGMVVTLQEIQGTYSYNIVTQLRKQEGLQGDEPTGMACGSAARYWNRWPFTLSCVMVGWLGTIPLAAHQVMITISQLFYLVLSGYGCSAWPSV